MPSPKLEIVEGDALAVDPTALFEPTRAGVLDRLAETNIRDHGGVPSFLGYHGFPATVCASVNDRVVHGIPSDADEAS